ncbi:1-acyl-sn-glycerol-3-phosphate acyltransferase [Mycoplasma sp. Ms02]|uniref:lysophospholipid acyltransferase family protein n=1 Tax=Mycoplasma sp. Ms02 TaxID=353851 RepID=UPI001C89E9C3|nr:lysophospholipid acyltransferase family protein [Mycoplasma sp. Ms02]QZE12555.1 1-acyl-sn-glycerol-3-phosphate acyltransferase [Mycoplasma sp. Ms02]
MSIKFKKIIFGLVWMFRVMKINSTARKYHKNPDMYLPQQRNTMLLRYAKKLIKIYNVDLKVTGYENLPKNGPALITPNHKSNIDPLVILAALEKQEEGPDHFDKLATFVAKKELEKKKTMRNTMSLLDTFTIDRQNFREALRTMNEFGAYIKENKTFGVVFPEGTRVKTDALGEFKAGAFKVAQKNYLSVIPTTIKNSKEAFNSKRKGRVEVEVIFHKPIKASELITQETDALASRVQKIVESKL